MKKDIRRPSIVIFLLFVVLSFSSCGKSDSSNTISQKGYRLQSQELAVLDALLKNESDVFLEGGDGFLFEDFLPVSASKVASEYEKNQVSADQKYFKKHLIVTGRILSINSGLGNEPYIVLQGGNPFLSPQIHFDRNYDINKIASLKKGQKVIFVCIGGGSIVGAPMFNKSSFANDYAAEKVAKTKSQVISFLSGDKIKSEKIKKIAIITIALAKVLPDSSTNFLNDKTIMQKAKQKMASISEELKLLGVDVSIDNSM
jgi:hypothetical protein